MPAIDELELEIEGLAPKKPDVVVETATAEPQTSARKDIEPEEALEAMRQRLAASESAKQDAERRAQGAEAQAAGAQQRAQGSELALVVGAIGQLNQRAEMLSANYAQASADGDWAEVANIQRQIGRNEAELLQLEQGKSQLEHQAARPAPQQQQISDPVEAYAASLTGFPKSAAWVRAHPEYARDPRLNQAMIGAHNVAVATGHALDSDSYFAAIENILGLTGGQDASRQPQQAHIETNVLSSASGAGQGRQASPPAAPVNGSGHGANGSRPNVVRLTSEQLEAAEIAGQTPQEYAVELEKIRKEKIH